MPLDIEMFYYFFSILIGYLIGSISPGYFFGKFLKKIDIREYGYHNTGAKNTFLMVGTIPGLATGIFDFFKGLLTIGIVYNFLNAPLYIVYLSGFSAILGHIFPFYLRFRGGVGIATAVGMLSFSLVRALQNQWIPWLTILVPLLAGFLFFFITKDKVSAKTIPYLVILFALFSFIYLTAPLNTTTIFLGLLLIFLFVKNACFLREDPKFFEIINKAKTIKDITSWRNFFRPFAILFPILYLYFDKKLILIFTGSLSAIFILIDLFRFGFKKANVFLFKKLFIKKKEITVFSSLSFFMLACFISFLVFEKSIAIIAVVFLIFGDLFSKIFGLLFGQRKFFQQTWEGAMASLTACLIFGYLFIHFLNFPFLILFAGALSASIIEALPIGIDDNFTVALISGAIMYLMIIL